MGKGRILKKWDYSKRENKAIDIELSPSSLTNSGNKSSNKMGTKNIQHDKYETTIIFKMKIN
jgi:hypothetical protein